MGNGIIIRAAHFPGRAPIDAYGNGGFRFADMSHRGSILALPSGIHGWEPGEGDSLGDDDVERILAEDGRIDILLIGTGRELRPLPKALKQRFRDAGGAATEPMSTGSAVRTYNILLAEDRAVAAALVAVD